MHPLCEIAHTFLARLLILIEKGGLLKLKSFPCILPKFVMHVTNDQFSDKLNNGWIFFKNCWLFEIFRILRQKFVFVGAIT